MVDIVGVRMAQADVQLIRHHTFTGISLSSRSLARIIGMVTIVLLAGSSAFGQFLVQPMKMEISLPPGRRAWPEIIIENMSDASRQVDLRVVDISQDPNGIWVPIEPDAKVTEEGGGRWVEAGPEGSAIRLDISKMQSCQSWLQVDSDSVQVTPYGRLSVRVRVDVPPGKRGYYSAAILASSLLAPARSAGFSTAVVLEFLIPVIIEVQGRPEPSNIKLTDVGLHFRRRTVDKPPATLVSIDIDNFGGTYSRLTGLARVWGKWGGHWRIITEKEFPDTGILPGIHLHLLEDVERALPSGEYKVEALLYVDGRRSPVFSKEFTFKGDERVSIMRGDASIDLDPQEVMIEAIPGATRSGRIAVFNASEETVEVDVELSLPPHMKNAVYDKLHGSDFDCSNWVTVSPQRFTLRGHRRQNLRILCSMPKTGLLHPNYYAMLTMQTRWPDGQSAGTTKARLCVIDKKSQGNPRLMNKQLTLSESAPNRYLVTARFSNIGNTHVMPDCRAVLSLAGDVANTPQRSFFLSSDGVEQRGLMLPLEKRNFTGVLDVSEVRSGMYRLTVVLTGDNGESVQGQTALRVVESAQRKVVEVMNVEEIGGATTIEL